MDAPAFQFYASDYLSSSKVQRMTLEEEGAYIRLLAYNWQDGFIPADIKKLARLCKVSPRKMESIWEALQECFQSVTDDPTKLVNLRLETVRYEKKEYHLNQSLSGKKGAEARWQAHRQAHKQLDGDPINSPMANGMANDSSPSPTPSSSSKLKTKPSVEPARPADVVFEIFKYWQAELQHPHSVLDDKRHKVITARIKEGYTKERIMQAIRGIKLSPHNMGQNDRNTKFDDIELICRTGANVDRFADMVPATQPVKIEPPKRTPCDRCGGDGLIASNRFTFRCPDCRNWEGRYGDVIPFYRTDTAVSEGTQ